VKLRPLKFLSLVTISCAIYFGLTASSSGNGGALSGCNCHGGQSSATSMSISPMPASYQNNEVIQFTVTLSNSTKIAAGFSLLPTIGSITNLGSGVKFFNSTPTITHTSPKSISGGQASWTFEWTAPATGSEPLVFNYVGNAVNGNGTTTGDAWRFGSFTSVPLPLVFVSIDLSKSDRGIVLDWEIASAINTSHFEVEKSFDGFIFQSIAKIDFTTEKKYRFIDDSNFSSSYYYRIKSIDFDGTIIISDIEKLPIENESKLDLYPSVVTQNEVTLKGVNEVEEVDFVAYSADGKLVKKQNSNTSSFDISGLPTGTYIITASQNRNLLITKRIFKL
jgi:hypothetical protein